jgi:arginine/lysine/ornithine decarboxylase
MLSLAKFEAIDFTQERVTAIFDLMKSSSPDFELRQLLPDLLKKMRKVMKLHREHAKLQKMIHKLEVASLRKEACDEHLKLLKEQVALLEEKIEEQNKEK